MPVAPCTEPGVRSSRVGLFANSRIGVQHGSIGGNWPCRDSVIGGRSAPRPVRPRANASRVLLVFRRRRSSHSRSIRTAAIPSGASSPSVRFRSKQDLLLPVNGSGQPTLGHLSPYRRTVRRTTRRLQERRLLDGTTLREGHVGLRRGEIQDHDGGVAVPALNAEPEAFVESKCWIGEGDAQGD